MPKQVIIPPGTPTPLAPFVPATLANGTLYVAGILSFDKDNNVLHVGDAGAQTRQVLETIKGIIEHAGGTMADITFNHVFIKDFADYQAVNKVYGEYFPVNPPARYCVRVDMVRPECLVEIASVAYIGDKA